MIIGIRKYGIIYWRYVNVQERKILSMCSLAVEGELTQNYFFLFKKCNLGIRLVQQ